MYLPKSFEETRIEVMHDLIRAHPLATLVTLGADGLTANHIPFYLDSQPAPFGRLQAHVARANPCWRDLAPGAEVLAIFQGPETYISPSWYATKRETGRVVPTWNYAVVHARGRLLVRDDPAWLRGQLERLTGHNEAAFAAPWQVADAPAEHTENLLRAIVGVELEITSLLGKWKMSQNQPAVNRASLIRGLRERGEGADAVIADLIPGEAE